MKKKQTFYQLENSQEILTSEEARAILGGSGVITGGSGTSIDPYVVRMDIYVYDSDSSGFASQIQSQATNQGTMYDNETAYVMDIHVNSVNVQPNMGSAHDQAITQAQQDLYDGASVGQVLEGDVGGSGFGLNSNGDPNWAQEGDTYDIQIDYSKISSTYAQSNFDQGGGLTYNTGTGGSGGTSMTSVSQLDFTLNTIWHELAHKMGLPDDYGSGDGSNGQAAWIHSGTTTGLWKAAWDVSDLVEALGSATNLVTGTSYDATNDATIYYFNGAGPDDE